MCFDSVFERNHSGSPETVPMVKLAVHEEPLHQVDVFVAGSAGAAQSVALDRRSHLLTCLRRLDWTVHADQDVHRTRTGRRHRGREQDEE